MSKTTGQEPGMQARTPTRSAASAQVRRGGPRWVRPLQTSLALLVVAVYLFVSAPPPLSAIQGTAATVPIATALQIVARENDAIRALYTQRIVGHGKQVGLAFNEAWQQPDAEAGPLPALLLRLMAEHLHKEDGQLSLFLGSAHPIASANRFNRQQLDVFATVSVSRASRVVYAADVRRYVAMFPDVAAVPACVECHNAHPRSPKHDWKLGDVMGATTWMHPEKELTVQQTLGLVTQVRRAARASYTRYLEKARTFAAPPEIGERWPSDGRFLPDADAFMEAVEQRAAAETLRRLLALSGGR